MEKCPYCAGPIKNDTVVCKSCGGNLSDFKTGDPATTPSPSPQWMQGISPILQNWRVIAGVTGFIILFWICNGFDGLGGFGIATEPPQFIPTDAPAPVLPVSSGSTYPFPSEAISPGNAANMVQLARWGRGTSQQVIYSPDGSMVAEASSLGVYLYTAETLQVIRLIETDSLVYGIAFSPDGQTLAGGMANHAVYLWNVSDGSLKEKLEGHSASVLSVVFSPDGTTLVSGSADGTLRTWPLYQNGALGILSGHTDAVLSLAFSPDGQHFASGSSDATVQLWSLGSATSYQTLTDHSGPVYSVDYSPDGEHLASGSTDGYVIFWDLNNTSFGEGIYVDTGEIRSLAYSPDGSMIAAGSYNTVHIFQVEDGTLLKKFEQPQMYAAVNSLGFSPDGSALIAGSEDYAIRLWRISDGTLMQLRDENTLYGNNLTFSPDGQSLASISQYGNIWLWSVKDGTPVRTLEGNNDGVITADFSPDGLMLATGHWDHAVRMWMVDSGKLNRTLEGHQDDVHSVTFSPDGQTLATGGYDNTIRLWNLSDGSLRFELTGHSRNVISLAFTSDGRTLASGSWDGTIRLWNVDDGSLLRTIMESGTVYNLVFSPDGQTLASGTEESNARVIHLWRANDGNLMQTLDRYIFEAELSFSPDGQILASSDRTDVILWQVSDGSLLRELKGHTSRVKGVEFSPDGRLLATASYDGTIRLWGVLKSDLAASEELPAATNADDPFFVDALTGGTYGPAGLPHVYVPPNALGENTRLAIREVESSAPDGMQSLGSAYDISIENGYVRKPIEIALPVTGDVDLSQSEVLIGYLNGENRWVMLPGWYSEEDGMVHATMDHFTTVKPFLSLFPAYPEITFAYASPNPYVDVGSPPCFQEDLKIWVGVEDPNDDLESVKVSLRLHTLATRGVEKMVGFANIMNGLGLVLTAGDPTALLPAASTTIIAFSMKDQGSIATESNALAPITEQGDVYGGWINLSALSNCGKSFNIDSIGLDKIDVNVFVEDRAGHKREGVIEIPIHPNRPPAAELDSPGPGLNDIQSPRPVFNWHLNSSEFATDIREIRLVYAKGDSLWSRSIGNTVKTLKWNDSDWQPPADLSPGKYVWGVEVVTDRGKTQSSVYAFTIPGLWSELTTAENMVYRTKIKGQYVGLTWQVYRGTEKVLARNAMNETSLNIREVLSSSFTDGQYRVWLSAVTEDLFGNRTTHQVSNEVTLNFISTPTPTATPTYTSTPRSTSTPVFSTDTPAPVYDPPTSSAPSLYLDQNYFCRTEPSTSAPDVTSFEKGARFPILSTTNTGWWLVQIDLSWSSHKSCWIGGGIPEGDFSSIPIVEAASGIPIYEFYELGRYPTGAWPVHFTVSCSELSGYRWGTSIQDGGVVMEAGPFYWEGDLVLQIYNCPKCNGDPKVFLASEGHRACPDLVK